MYLNSILYDLFRDTPLNHIWRGQKLANYSIWLYLAVFEYLAVFGGPLALRSMCLNSILYDLFRDTPLNHIWRGQELANYSIWLYLAVFGCFAGPAKYGRVVYP